MHKCLYWRIKSDEKYIDEKFENLESVKIGDIVKHTSLYGETVFGIITDVKDNKTVIFKTFPPGGKPFYWEVKYKQLIKIVH